MKFNEKVILITGAGSGIGRETALQFSREGAKLMLADVNEVGLAKTAQQIEEEGGEAQAIRCDVSQTADVRDMVDATLARYGALHVAINSAGISGAFVRPLTDTTEEDFDRVIAVNLKGVWLCMKYEIPAIVQSGGGSIINLASVAGLIGAPGGADYSASKHGVIGLTRSASLETVRLGVRVNAVCPSFIETPMVTNLTEQDEKMAQRTRRASPMQRLGTTHEVAGAICWLASEEASFVNGVAFAIDGGLTAM